MSFICLDVKINVGILGATGIVGQQLIRLLENHPWFEVAYLAASETSSGKRYEEAVAGRWHQHDGIPPKISGMTLHSIDEIQAAKECCQIVFSALQSDAAKIYDSQYAAAGLVVLSLASCHRGDPKVPLIIPEINPEHLQILPRGKGYIVSKPNCSIQSIMLPLFPLHGTYGVKKIAVTTLQSVSGAGFPGISSLQITDNVIPYIEGEEDKTETEPLKIWGEVVDGKIVPTKEIAISAHCTRVPVLDGHLSCVSVQFEKKPTKEQILACWNQFQGLSLPSAPVKPVIYLTENDRPQPRLDRGAGKGMAITVGRLRECPLFDYRFTALSHNTIRGAGGGSILTAELLVQKKLI